jgi:hypothetical protein
VARRALVGERHYAFACAVALGAAVACALAGAPARAQLLNLHVRSFSMSADRASVALGEPFHLTISTHVDERVLQIDNLTLPDLAGFDSLGDERRCAASAGGSDCVEIVTLAATIAGSRTIAGATLDAVDARDGKASRFTTNSVVVEVTGTPGDELSGMFSGFLFGALRAALIGLVVLLALGALLWNFLRRRPAPPTPAAVEPASVPPVPDSGAGFRDLVDALAREPTRANALRVRHAMRASMNARDAETLADLRARRAAEPATLDALAAVERAAFCEDARVARAAQEAMPFLIR